MRTLKEIQSRLADRKLLAVARESGIHVNVLSRIKNGDSGINLSTYLKLVNYLFPEDGTTTI
jgi:hypothetical protein